MSSSHSEFAAAIDKIVADCNDRLQWVPYSKDKLTKEAARVLIEQWSNFTRHSRQCWALRRRQLSDHRSAQIHRH